MISHPEKFGKVAVLMGGLSAEREISLMSGKAVFDALLKKDVDVVAIDVGIDVLEKLALGSFDRVFNVLHGRGGEDGQIQGVLETLRIPYTGSDVLGSALSMDKYRTKLVWQASGLPTPPYVMLENESDLTKASELGFPLMIKPIREGSSIGMSKVDNAADLKEAWKQAKGFDNQVMAELWISGKEYTCAVLGETPLPVIGLETNNEFYDYQAKYQSSDTAYLLPCGLSEEEEKAVQDLSLKAFYLAGVSGWGRVDLMMDENESPWLIEVNTVPGMTDHSLVPMAAKASGIEFEELVWKILEQTLEAA